MHLCYNKPSRQHSNQHGRKKYKKKICRYSALDGKGIERKERCGVGTKDVQLMDRNISKFKN